MRKTFLALALLSVPAAAQAQSHCNGNTQRDANICAQEHWQIADDELNRLWKIVKPRADARGRGRALLQAQRSWLKYRDRTCEEELAGGGSAAQMFYWRCMEELTLSRNAELRAMM